MEKMVGLFTVVVEGKVEFTPAVTIDYVKRRLKKAIEKEVHAILNHTISELDVDDQPVWTFTPASTDLEEGGTIVRRLSDLVRDP